MVRLLQTSRKWGARQLLCQDKGSIKKKKKKERKKKKNMHLIWLCIYLDSDSFLSF